MSFPHCYMHSHYNFKLNWSLLFHLWRWRTDASDLQDQEHSHYAFFNIHQHSQVCCCPAQELEGGWQGYMSIFCGLWFVHLTRESGNWALRGQMLHSEGERIDKSSLCFHILNNMKCGSNCRNLESSACCWMSSKTVHFLSLHTLSLGELRHVGVFSYYHIPVFSLAHPCPWISVISISIP